jgi:hypothetical protein
MPSATPESRGATGALIVALLIHGGVVASIVAQPLNVNAAASAQRSIIWPLHNDTIHRDGPGTDLFAVYNAGLHLELGHNPYGRRLAAEGALPYWTRFRYLPILAETLGRATTLAAPRTVYLAWVAVLEATLLGLCALFRLAAPLPWLRWAGPCFLLLSSPYFLELHMGQFTFITAALYFVALWLCTLDSPDRKRTLAAATSYAAAALLKIVPLVAIPALLRTHRGRVCAAAAVAVVVALSAPLFWEHPRWWHSFREENLVGELPVGGGGNFGLMFVLFQTAADHGQQWTAENWAVVTRLAQILFIGSAALAAFFSRERSVLAGGAALYLGHTLSYFHVWEHHMSGVIVLGLALLWGLEGERAAMSSTRAETPGRWISVIIIVALVALALPTPYVLFDDARDPKIWDPTETWPAYARYVVPLSKALPTVMLYVASMRILTAAGFALPWRAFATPSADLRASGGGTEQRAPAATNAA